MGSNDEGQLSPVPCTLIHDKEDVMISRRLERSSCNKSCLKKAQNLAENRTRKDMPPTAKSVSFNKIEINEFPMELGDNPSAVHGVPVQIGWTPLRKDVFELDDYEELTEFNGKRAKIIPPDKRLGYARLQGATCREINLITREKKMIQQSRIESINNMQWDRYHDRVESVQRKLGKLKKAASFSSFSSTASSLTSCSVIGASTANATFDLHRSESSKKINASKIKQIVGLAPTIQSKDLAPRQCLRKSSSDSGVMGRMGLQKNTSTSLHGASSKNATFSNATFGYENTHGANEMNGSGTLRRSYPPLKQRQYQQLSSRNVNQASWDK